MTLEPIKMDSVPVCVYTYQEHDRKYMYDFLTRFEACLLAYLVQRHVWEFVRQLTGGTVHTGAGRGIDGGLVAVDGQ